MLTSITDDAYLRQLAHGLCCGIYVADWMVERGDLATVFPRVALLTEHDAARVGCIVSAVVSDSVVHPSGTVYVHHASTLILDKPTTRKLRMYYDSYVNFEESRYVGTA